jgi:hypothetical protein
MGEHWVNMGRVFVSWIDPARPAMLSYASIAGVPTLVGVVYVRALLADEQPPEWPAGREAWHHHTLSVVEEALALDHTAHGSSADLPPRLALLHAWVWLDNPAGQFAADNWALPFARLGITAPPDVSPAAAKAASLLTGGDRHLLWVLERVVRPDTVERSRIVQHVEAYRERARAALEDRSAGPIRVEELAALERTWHALWADMDGAVSAATADRLRALSAR